jgi:glycosyltransferase involved in cell wall biosynthesis
VSTEDQSGSAPLRLLVIVPALDEGDCIADVVRSIRSTLAADVLVVDDGSSDATALRAHEAGATVVSHPYNLGVGAAIRTAMRFADERGYEVVVQIDGDGQHDPGDAKRLLDVIDEGFDLVVGSRFESGYHLSMARRMTMRFLSRVVSRRATVLITDTTSGYRAFNRRAIRLFSRHYPTDYLSDTVESLLLAADAGLTIREVSVNMRPRTSGRASARKLKSSYYMLRLLLILMLHRLRRPVLLTEEP